MSVNPDEGMQLLTQRMAADRSVRQAHEPRPDAADGSTGDGGSGFDLVAALGVMVRAATAMESMAARLEDERRRHFEKVHPVEIYPVDRNLAGSQSTAGSYTDPDRWGPNDGWAWRVMGWTISLGPGATSFSIYLDSNQSPSNLVFTSTVSGRWEPAHFYMMPDRTLFVTSVGGPLIFGQGNAVEIAIDYLPTYMGLHP